MLVPRSLCITAKHLLFAWDLFREFRDSLKIAKFNTSEFGGGKKSEKFVFSKKNAFTYTSISMYTSDSILYYTMYTNDTVSAALPLASPKKCTTYTHFHQFHAFVYVKICRRPLSIRQNVISPTRQPSDHAL